VGVEAGQEGADAELELVVGGDPGQQRGELDGVGELARWQGGFDRNLRAPVLSRFVGQRLRMLASKERQGDLQTLRELIEAGKLTPVIGRTYPLGEVPEAIRQLVGGHGRSGKIVITV
jgi:NADPH:quinone reductase-like Zn-dependent oxidoreductase